MLENYVKKILEELYNSMNTEEVEDYSDVCRMIEMSDRIFLAGAGRTGYIMRCFSMRLMQAGFQVYWIGDNNTCSAREGDLLIIGSGSGETGSLCVFAEKAAALHVKRIVFTARKMSRLGRVAELTKILNADIKYDSDGEKLSIQPMGTLFEEKLFIVLEAVVLKLMERNHIEEKDMQQRHANLE